VANSNPSGFVATAERLFFAASDGVTGVELWAAPLSAIDPAPTASPTPPDGSPTPPAASPTPPATGTPGPAPSPQVRVGLPLIRR
jgi:hypothetical protein